jgi:hypothetical protein
MLPKSQPESNPIFQASFLTFLIAPRLSLINVVAEAVTLDRTSLRPLPLGFRLAASTPWDASKYSRFRGSNKGKTISQNTHTDCAFRLTI